MFSRRCPRSPRPIPAYACWSPVPATRRRCARPLDPSVSDRVVYLGLVEGTEQAGLRPGRRLRRAQHRRRELASCCSRRWPAARRSCARHRGVPPSGGRGRAGATFANEDPADLARVAIGTASDAEGALSPLGRGDPPGPRSTTGRPSRSASSRSTSRHGHGEKVTEDMRGQPGQAGSRGEAGGE